MQSLFSKLNGVASTLSSVVEATGGRNPFALIIEKPISSTVGIIEGRKTLLFGTNNYLGFSQLEPAIKAAQQAVAEYGTGTTGSRVTNGTQSLHRQLEKDIAAFFKRRDAMVFSTGYQANLGIISTLAGKGDHLFLDADCHASIYDGSRLGHADVIRFRHNDPNDLYKRIKRVQSSGGSSVIVIEGIYSMTGNIAPMKEFAEVKRETGACLIVDEAHSFGVMGREGRGVGEMAGVEGDIDFIIGTFSKSLGTVGGYCVSDHPELEIVRVSCRPYMFTASLPPEVIAATRASLLYLEEHPQIRTKLMKNAQQLHKGLTETGLNVSKEVCPVIAVTLDDVPKALPMWNKLLELGVYVNVTLPPATPDSRPLLRCSVMATHTPEQINEAIEIFRQAAKETGNLPS